MSARRGSWLQIGLQIVLAAGLPPFVYLTLTTSRVSLADVAAPSAL